MYLPKSQYTEKVSVDEIILDENGQPVTGMSILTSFGTAMSVPSKADIASGNFKNSKPFTKVAAKLEDLFDWDQLGAKKDKVYYPKPTEKDYLNGYLDRYFVQDKRTRRIIEADEKGYRKAKTRPTFKRIALKWVIKGPAEDQTIGKYIYPGAEAQNKNIIEQAEEHMKGLKEHIKDYKQFVK